MTPRALRPILTELKARGLFVRADGELPDRIEGVADDSRSVVAGGAFVAVKGSRVDGHGFLADARYRGAAVAIVEHGEHGVTMPTVQVTDSAAAAAVVADAYYDFPSRELRVVGVTGTNGKTTTVHILRHILDEGGSHGASVGTLGVLLGAEGVPMQGREAALTTPGGVQLAGTLRALVDAGVRNVAMEVSSHSLEQRRVDAIRFAASVYTNLSHDHLDYHGTMHAYYLAKAHLVQLTAESGAVIINADEREWDRLATGALRVVRFSTRSSECDVFASELSYGEGGSSFLMHTPGASPQRVTLPLVGDFNVANALAAASAAHSLGYSADCIARTLSGVGQVPGRMERISDSPVVLRDYAHTPDALQRALLAAIPFAPRGVCVVFGCGGDRDRAKRPVMGAIASRLATTVILTSDNPRTEDPEGILDDIAGGIRGGHFQRIEDRRQAIAAALEHSRRSGELVLLAGKGHEDYQIRGTTKIHFDEKEIVNELLRGVS